MNSMRVRSQRRARADLSLVLLAALFVVSVVAFGAYYYLDRRIDPGQPMLDRGAAALEEAVRADPSNYQSRLELGKVYQAKGRKAEAIEQYRAALQIVPADLDASMLLAQIQYFQNDLASARPIFEAVVAARKDMEFAASDPYLQAAYYYLGDINRQEQQYQTAIDQLLSATSITRTDADAWYSLCQAYNAVAEGANAVTACRNAVLLIPKWADAYLGLATAYQSQGQTLEARYATAMVRYAKGQNKEAAKTLNEVVKQDPGFWDAFVGLGMAEEALNHHDEAVAAYKQAIALDPTNFNARLGLGRLGAAEQQAAEPDSQPPAAPEVDPNQPLPPEHPPIGR